MRNKTILFFLIPAGLLLALAAVYFFFFQGSEDKHFQRLRFRVVQGSEELQFDAKRHNWVSVTGKKIPYVSSRARGTGILFEGSGELVLAPGAAGVTGEKGIFFRVGARSMAGQKISLAILVERGGVAVFREERAGDSRGRIRCSFSHLFFDLQKEDRVVIRARGKGALVAGDPLVYDLIEKEKRKYVFIVALDTLRWDKIGHQVNGIDLTPNINRFKRDAVVFERAYAQGSWTLPSFTSFFTGLYEFNHKISRETVLDAQIPFLIEDFARHFMTASIHGGTWLSGKVGNSRGFDSYELGSRTKDVYAGRTLFENATRFVEQQPVPALFLFLHTYAIHAPYEPPQEFLVRLNRKPRFSRYNTFARKRQYLNGVSAAVRKAMEELYEAEILAFDHYFGEFLAYLKKKSIYDQSLIVFLSDHGEEFYEHRGWSHGHSLYNELIKVPLIVKFPGSLYRGKVIADNVALIDVLPTLMDYLKIESDSKIDGASLMPLIEGRALAEKVVVSSSASCPFFDQVPRKIALLAGRFKLVYNFDLADEDREFFQKTGLPPETEKFQVFDLVQDPQEKHNLYPERKDLLHKFQDELREIVKKVHAALELQGAAKITFDDKELETLKTLGYL